IWNSAEIQNNTVTKKVVRNHKVKPATAKLAQQASQKIAADKLARQRVIWKTKWDAQQLAKKQALAKTTTGNQAQGITSTTKISKIQPIPTNKSNNDFTAAELALASVQPAKSVQKAPAKQLTRAQYQWRWKQAQLKKQQLAESKNPTFTNESLKKYASKSALAKPAYAAFRQNKQKAILNSLPHGVRTKLNAAKLNTHGMSAYVKAVNSPRPLLGHQEQTSRVPASVMKLITSYAALGTLGPNYRWPLDVMTNGVVRNGTLKGDLIIKGYGSPEFNKVELRKVLQGIKRKGIRNVSGRVLFDNSYFNVGKEPSFDGKSQSAYNAQPDALLFNERINSFQVRAKGKRVHVSTTTPTHNLKIVNRMKKTRRGCRPRIRVSRNGVQTVVTFSGRFSRRCGTRTYSRVISRPAEMIYGAMQAMWKRDVGGNLRTHFAVGRAPANAKPLLRTHSRTLAEILPTIDKDSNNVMARQVMLTIGAKMKGQGTQRGGAEAIGDWLVSRGLNFPELRIENGSGLSRHARISARHVGDLLMDAYRSPHRNVLMQSLAIAGVDGTMKRRLKGSRVRGRGFFKTGTLRDVRSIAGYVKAADGKTYVMAILHNDPRAKSRALAAHDKLIEWVYSGGREQVAMK
ncbi:MAG: D-alanyl-D-alanine carboxypeptidase/D-alanyl-D-alanine-endopeptidase, partial [Cocleimonas sp.]